MTKVCLIGNSHVAALKLGWPRIQARFPTMDLVFFASAGLSITFEVQDGKLVCPDPRIRKRLALTSGGEGDIEPVYDVYVLCGLELSSMRAFRAYAAKRRAEKAAVGRTVEDLVAAMEPALRDTIAIEVAAKLRALTEAPMFMIATPLPAHERHVEFWDRLKALEMEATVAQSYHLACKNVAGEHEAIFLPQPAQTVGENGLTTRNRFYLLKPDQVAAEKSLHTHMNPDYGAIVLRDALEKIEALTKL
ncbi:MAG: hypothetical protein JOZ72_09650 [Alphaproteobacteria bacterium]|nr:hypothetical protein [Alphaproteobacteria bacterium]